MSQRALAVHLLRQFVNEHNLGVTDAAKTLGFSQSAMSDWLNGKRLPNMKSARILLSRMEDVRLAAKAQEGGTVAPPTPTPPPPIRLPEELLKAFSDAVVALMRKQTSVDGCTKILTAAVAASE